MADLDHVLLKVGTGAFLTMAAATCQPQLSAGPFAPPDAGAGGAAADARIICVYWCHDRDGDQKGGPTIEGEPCHPSDVTPPAGVAVCAGDCDDGDPEIWRWAGLDGDGDGFRPADNVCVGSAVPAGFRLDALPGDCDDSDRARNPGVPEQYADGIDSDCDGRSDPHDCAGTPAACGCGDLVAPSPVAIDGGCGGRPDPFIAKTLTCPTRCGLSELFVVIGNRGDAPWAGPIPILTSSSWRSQKVAAVFEETLEPGEVSKPINLTGAFGLVTVALDLAGAVECNAGNSTTELPVNLVECF
jgi:hypothetical protein